MAMHEHSLSPDLTTLRTSLKGTNLYLIGMMGAGKSTVGRLLASQLTYQFFDTDTVVEQIAGQSISTIFAEAGEANFRELETRVLKELSAYKQLAIATGGGIVLQRQNWSYLRHGIIIWLDVPVAQLIERLERERDRPLLQDTDRSEMLHHLMEQRRPLYAQADIHLPVHNYESPEQVLKQVVDSIKTMVKPRL